MNDDMPLTDSDGHRLDRLGLVLTLAGHLVGIITILVILLHVAPGYQKLYRDMGLTLPAASRLTLSLAAQLRIHALLLLPSVVPLLAADGALYYLLVRKAGPAAGTVYSLVLLLILLLGAAALLATLHLPLHRLQNAL